MRKHGSGGHAEERHSSPIVSAVHSGQQQSSVMLDDSKTQVLLAVAGSNSRWRYGRLWELAAFGALILLGALLRFWGLGDKPLHHDESLHAYFSMHLMHDLEHWQACFDRTIACYHYDPLLHGPFQFHVIALVYKVSQWFGIPEQGINTVTARIAAAMFGTVLVGLPFFLRDYLGRFSALLACFLLAISPSMVYFSRFTREDIYMACFTLLLVVGIARYWRDRKGLWLVLAMAALSLAYATKEATFLMLAVFGTFLGALVAWELGARRTIHIASLPARLMPHTAAPFFVLGYFLLLAPIAKLFFGWMKDLSLFISRPESKVGADQFIAYLKDQTVGFLPWLGALICCYALWCLLRTKFRNDADDQWQGLARLIDPQRQPLLNAVCTMPVFHWFAALFCGFVLFVLLFSVLFTYTREGIGDGIWQGLYYWLQQQHVARGGQPWYYYLLLIPLYEALGVVFGLAGVLYCLRRPSRFRLFLVYWLVGNLVIYSWAGEKMPWLMIHMTMPLLLLAALGLRAFLLVVWRLIMYWRACLIVKQQADRSRFHPVRQGRILLGVFTTIFLLALTLQNMVQVVYVHPDDAPYEMMIYVQTTPDVHTVMSKIAKLDQELHAGQHKLSIGVTSDASWPFYWYLRGYSNVCYNFPTNCAEARPAVIVSAGNSLLSSQRYAVQTEDGQAPEYLFKRYRLRTWWDEGYKPLSCVPDVTNTCKGESIGGGVGLFHWLSYGNTPPPDAAGDIGLASKNVWEWWWHRQPIGSTMGSTDMGLLIRKDLEMMP